MKRYLFIIGMALWLLIPQNGKAQITISSSNFITKFVSSETITEAGMDFQKDLELSANEIILSVTIPPQNLDNVIYNSWQIDVIRNDFDWNEALELFIRRTADGKSDYNSKPQNGDYYQKIETNNSFFFTGQGWIYNIPIQLKITGLSVILPAKSYSSEIIFTLIDN